MKTSGWISIIGILCIVFGALGIISNISSFFMPQWIMDTWSEIPALRQKWMEQIELIGIVVNAIYLMAGIFFLRKKSFSLLLMFIALICSLLYVIIPLFFFKSYDDLIFVMIGPVIDICLLIMVYRIRKYYADSPDKIVKFLVEIEFSPQLLRLLTVVGLLCISIATALQGLWIYVFSVTDNYSDAITLLQSFYHESIHSTFTTVYISSAFCLLAIILSGIGMKLSGKLWKTLNTSILILGSLLLFLNLFQMM